MVTPYINLAERKLENTKKKRRKTFFNASEIVYSNLQPIFPYVAHVSVLVSTRSGESIAIDGFRSELKETRRPNVAS